MVAANHAMFQFDRGLLNKMMEAAMGMQGVGFLMTIFIGGLAGFIAEKLTKSTHGLLTNIFLGIAGAVFMKFALGLVGVRLMFAGWFIGNLLVATAGAVALIVIWRAIKGR